MDFIFRNKNKEKVHKTVESSKPENGNSSSNIQSEPENQYVPRVKRPYSSPPISLLSDCENNENDTSDEIKNIGRMLDNVLYSIGIDCIIVSVTKGPITTCFAVQLGEGVRFSQIKKAESDIQLALAVNEVRVEIIPGTTTVGIYIPNSVSNMVTVKDMLTNIKVDNITTFCVGRDTAGNYVACDLDEMPHLLIAGTTGSGKSVFLHSIIMNYLFCNNPDNMKFIMVDTKKVELSPYNGIPHLLMPVVTDGYKAVQALKWLISEMTARYNTFAKYGVKNIAAYNKLSNEPLARIILIIDELADLMMTSPKEVEESVVRIGQIARAAGIHMILATQKPASEVITPMIKANVPARISFKVNTWRDSQTILNSSGAEELMGNGDMLYYPSNSLNPIRVQGAYVSEEEVESVTSYLRNNNDVEYIDFFIGKERNSSGITNSSRWDLDPYFEEAAYLVVEQDKASIGYLQRRFKIGFNRAAKLMDQLCENAIVSGEVGTAPRRVLMSLDQLDRLMEELLG